ncbi:hypothetical protein B0A55_09506 [Friedmanniomyces simplex]|uniref:C2H2-type domain-containing protein n=1 Tax=Friedmanniomyces simplex TaxID=329884 RepID=A0A4U0WLD2_9PEZI|nr:hypothetical protein B0A55_09506 [Friedmanniomyces simplex]
MSMQCSPYQPYPSVRQQYPIQSIQPRRQQPPSQQYYSEPAPRPPTTGQYVCLYAQCANARNFARYADLQRHVQVVHNPETLQRVDCEYPGCHRKGEHGFSRKDKMVDHMREVHKAEIPKRSPGRKSP